MKKTITTEKLQTMRKAAEGFLLVDVHDKAAFARDHIPGARNVPLDTEGFAAVVAEKNAGSRSRRVVIYSAGPNCEGCAKAAKLLVADNFTNVVQYEGGLSAWNEQKRARLARSSR